MPELTALAESAIREIDRNVPVVEVTPMSKLVSKAGARMKFVLVLLAAGAAATLALGVVGLYGVIAYVVGLRSREIGIRIALGLEPSHAARMILKDGERIIVAGAVVGLLVFIAFARLLDSLTFDVSVLDCSAVATSAAIVLVVATVATWLPARRAARIDPTEALKSD
jgi:ABC-type antimicrobial peptide transport system permease subunit